MKFKLSFILIFILLFSGCNIFEQGTIKFGFIGPLTGDPSIYGLRVLDMYNLAIEEINLNGGINGKQVELIVYDGKCSKLGGEFAASELIEKHKVKIIFGVPCSDETLGAAPLAEENEVILISSFAQSEKISNAGDFIFRVNPSDYSGFKKLAVHAYDLGYRKVASISEVTAFTSSQRKIFIHEFENLGGEVVLVEGYPKGETDISKYFERLNDFDFDSVLLLAQSYGGYVRMKDSMVSLGFDDYQLFSNFLIGTDKIYDEHFNFYAGTLFPDNYVDKDSEKSKQLIKKIDLNYNLKSFFSGIPFWGVAASYDLPYIMKKAIERCEFYETSCIKEKLYGISDFSGYFDGFDGFDKNGDGIFEQNIFIIDEGGVRRFD